MRLYISIDMEGMPGTFNWEHEKADRPAVKRYIANHVRCVLESILAHPRASGIEEIWIADSHGAGDNLDYEITALDERISLISGSPRPLYMMPELDPGFDQVFLLGYHSGTGALRGNMDHTYSNSRIHKIFINGKPMNEAMINSAYAGYHKVPVTLVTGDEALRKELEAPMPWLDFVATKQATAKFAARNYSQGKLCARTKAAVVSALQREKGQVPLFGFEAPITLRIEFQSTSMADLACLMPYAKRVDGRTVEYTDNDYAIVFEAIMALVTLAFVTTI
jgi:D-amino peptidase